MQTPRALEIKLVLEDQPQKKIKRSVQFHFQTKRFRKVSLPIKSTWDARKLYYEYDYNEMLKI